MQTFLPYADFTQSARALDWRRLGKQRVETWQILRALTGASKGWVNHPATKMWKGHVPSLAEYGVAMCDEWIRRGYNDTLRPKMLEFYGAIIPPLWLGDERLHSSHRGRLLMKDPVWYGQHNWTEKPSEVCWWPV